MSLGTVLHEHRRHGILSILAAAGPFEHSEQVLASALAEAGLPISRDDLRDELRWLEGRGLVRLAYPAGTWQARLLRKGHDVAQGTDRVEGVHPPLPE